MSRGTKALVLWSREGKTGIEPVSNVPETARFEGAISSVRFSGDRKWYPAKILLISDNQIELENAAVKVEEQLVADMLNEKENLPPKRSRTRKTSIPSLNVDSLVSSAASERSVAKALGQKPPVPKHFEETRKSLQRSKKADKEAGVAGQLQLEADISSKIRKNLFTSVTQAPNPAEDESGSERDPEENFDLDDEDEEDYSGKVTDEDNGDEVSNILEGEDETSAWCSSCNVCATLQKYDDPSYYSFLKDVLSLFEKNVPQSGNKMFLKLKPIPEGVRTVELRKNTGVLISADQKQQLKVDFKNKPSSLIRETLFALYGEEAFRTCKVTGRGNVTGAFTISPNVLSALCSFVNNNVAKTKMLRVNQLVAVINKRAREWKKSPKVKVTPKPCKKRPSSNLEVISTSPFKCVPQDSPAQCQLSQEKAGNSGPGPSSVSTSGTHSVSTSATPSVSAYGTHSVSTSGAPSVRTSDSEGSMAHHFGPPPYASYQTYHSAQSPSSYFYSSPNYYPNSCQYQDASWSPAPNYTPL